MRLLLRMITGINVLLIRSLLEQQPAARGRGKAVAFQGRGSRDGENVRLPGRQAECALLDQLVAAVRTGESRVLVVHGAPGIGKSALLDYAENSADGVRVLRA